MQEKAYKLLAIQEGVSNKEAKKLIDDGLVFVANKKIQVARKLMDAKTNFNVQKRQKPQIISQTQDLIAINKPIGLDSYDLEKIFKAKLIHRLDKTTSGIILLAKNEDFRQKVLKEFKEKHIYKEYIAIAEGIISQEQTINSPIFVHKGQTAKAKIDLLKGKEAISQIFPLEIRNKNTLLKVVIKTGRTHQIRIHLSSIAHPILGDTLYGGKESKRIYLHSKKIILFGKTYECKEDF